MQVISFQDWQKLRKRLMDDELRERQGDLTAARSHIQAAVTERAVRELWAKAEALTVKVEALEKRK